ncbi:16S rRNA (guanine(527)-N(7))-methyltransferase RsmG [Roseovarius sp. SCSIO 43702]|uniref:16S rRNA (guanine(527)-N(7))-methyltransferase RsmG n=1 Tax=Roseovarius sp. SCSIO 43702 TaxID=2823043 RepID=UPI001C730CEB|nr:16S rRNA (guanine(527)-N(7))-methyltransferase RsmG [Roseovarius sp. SCSIO 43702]QYX56996.1 16S rRNA (guanine(527)-N(7))-methyltransferase RsmG [Roseovarius sp. SCSIO 43702]
MMLSEEWEISGDTKEKLAVYAELLRKWNPKINLVSKDTLQSIEDRHFKDSAQLFHLDGRQSGRWVDLGSGGGFPGMIIAILASELDRDRKVTLVESDSRKCAFLRTVSRETSTPVEILNDRVENVPELDAATLSARALAPLDRLLNHCERHLCPSGTALFPKGAEWEKELNAARVKWRFDCEAIRSATNANARILKISGVSRVGQE